LKGVTDPLYLLQKTLNVFGVSLKGGFYPFQI